MPDYGVSFYTSALSDNRPPQVVEDAIRMYASLTGSHDFAFRSRLDIPSISINHVGSGWSIDWQDEKIPFDCVVSATVSAGTFAFAVGTPYQEAHYLIGIDPNGFGFLQKTDGTVIYSENRYTGFSGGPVTLSFREIAWREEESDKWAVASIFIGGRHVFSATYPVSTFMYMAHPCTDYRLGIAGYNGIPITYTNVRVPQLTNYIEWNSIDPGEYPIGGLGRALEGRYIRFFYRHNGSIAAYRPYHREPVAHLTAQDVYRFSASKDNRKRVSHFRMIGAYKEAEYIDNTAPQHRFVEGNNPMLMTLAESVAEARMTVLRQQEEYHTATIEMVYRPLWEIDDVISFNGIQYVITSIEYKLTASSGFMTLGLRRYLGAE